MKVLFVTCVVTGTLSDRYNSDCRKVDSVYEFNFFIEKGRPSCC